MKLSGWIFYVLLALLSAVFLELNHNTLLGWLLFAVLLIGFPLLSNRFFPAAKWWGKLLAFAGFIAAMALITVLSWPPVERVPAVNIKNPSVTEAVMTEYGPVAGVLNKEGNVEIFAGIPYAKPPVNDMRWRRPADPEPWQETLVCDTFAPMSMQVTNLPVYDSLVQIIGYHDYSISLNDNYRPAVSEDSLYLNLWKPAGNVSGLPVIVYIHGGSLQTGQPWYADYSGEGFAKSGVIAVNMGYRLGVFGFLAEEKMLEEEGTAGNFGLLDQIKALEWVRDNIAQFGGDPDNVTIVGESAGAVCVDALCVSPLAKGLFHRAVMESSTISSPEPPHSFRLFEEALASGKNLMDRYGVATLEELRALPAEKIVQEMNTQHHVTVDGTVLTDLPYNLRKNGVHNETALLHGFNREESGPFILFDKANLKTYESKVRKYFGTAADEVLALYSPKSDAEADQYWAEIYGALFFNYSHDCISRLMQDQEPVYQYLFSKTNGRLSCWHSGELPYVFGVIPNNSPLYDESDRALSKLMHQYWVNFAKTGNPNGGGLPSFAAEGDQLMEFDRETSLIDNPYRRLYDILDSKTGFRSDTEN